LINPDGAYQSMIAIAHGLYGESAQYDFTQKKQTNPSGFLPETLCAVFQAFVRTDSFEAALIDVVNRGGDADTTGAILGFMAGALYGARSIPSRWLQALNGHVRQACEVQARQLLEQSPIISGAPVRFIPD
jgi:ADP-ribosyl-[dinitrogen reductase] hydrolase